MVSLAAHTIEFMLDLPAYLERIDYRGPTAPAAGTLRALHRAHMFAVPFENLDIHLGRTILCDVDRFLEKIVNRRRGGFCYELNGAFAALLTALGFEVTLLSARVARPDASFGPEFDHLALRVSCSGRHWQRIHGSPTSVSATAFWNHYALLPDSSSRKLGVSIV